MTSTNPRDGFGSARASDAEAIRRPPGPSDQTVGALGEPSKAVEVVGHRAGPLDPPGD